MKIKETLKKIVKSVKTPNTPQTAEERKASVMKEINDVLLKYNCVINTTINATEEVQILLHSKQAVDQVNKID